MPVDKERGIDAVKVGELVRTLRERRGWTQAELARRMGKAATEINRVETGKRPITKIDWLLGFSDVFEVPVNYFLGPQYAKDSEDDLVRRVASLSEADREWLAGLLDRIEGPAE